MSNNKKTYKTIGEVAKILNLVNKKTGKLSTYTIRFWEKEFKEIKPYIFAGNRRYYDQKSIKVLKKIQYLLKNQGMTIKGVKKQLQSNHSDLDEANNQTINTKTVKNKLNRISSIIKEIKKDGKKNTR